MLRVATIGFLAAFAIAPALAQTADVPAMGSSAAQADDADELTRVLVLGDGVGGGLGAGLMRMGEIDGRYEVAIRFNEESGLARPEVYDWAETLPKILESSGYDVIVALIGTNDRQMIRSGNARYAFNSPDWIAAYKLQMDRVLDILTGSGARVYWVSLPPMADAEYDAAMRVISDLQRQQAEAKGAVFLDIRPKIGNPDGSFAESGPDDTGEIRRLRGRDGISFFKQGNNRLGQLVLQAIAGAGTPPAAPVARPEPDAAPVARPEPVAAAKVNRQEREVPLFGQNLMLGEVMTLRPSDVTVNAVLVVRSGADALAPSATLAAIRAMAPAGSSADRLFTRGESSAAPPGRADDFSAPAAAE